MSIHDLLVAAFWLTPFVVLIAQTCRLINARRRHERSLRSAFAQVADLADVVQRAIVSDQTQRASEAAEQIERLARQAVLARP